MAETRGHLRQLLLLQMLSSTRRGVTLREMAGETGSSQRTISRDLNDLQQAGFLLTASNSAHGRRTWQLKFDSEAAQPVFSFDELAVLYSGRRLLDPLIGTSLQDGACKALEKIRATLPGRARKYQQKLCGQIHCTSSGTGDCTERGELVEVRIQFVARVTRHVEGSRQHARQQISTSHNGSVTATVTLNALEEVQSWLLSFCSLAEVLKPNRSNCGRGSQMNYVHP